MKEKPTIEGLKKTHFEKREEIRKRLKEFEEVFLLPDERVFEELAFCLFTPQSSAKICDKAVKRLKEKNMLLEGEKEEIAKMIYGVRFHNNKASHLVEARKVFAQNSRLTLKEKISSFKKPEEAREWLVENVKGLGYKEASHFLRNIGFGRNLAILDVHILKNLHSLEVIPDLKVAQKKNYLLYEEKMKQFAEKIGIPLAELDLVLWSKETGEVFK